MGPSWPPAAEPDPLVRYARARFALAAITRRVRDLGQRDYASADDRGGRDSLFRAVHRPLSHGSRSGPRESTTFCGFGRGSAITAGRNLRLAAKQLVAQTGEGFPRLSELLELPGVGRYTAGAIASLAYDRPAPIVEANTLRVYARLLAYEGDVHSTTGRNAIWTFAERAVPRRSAGIFNQALIDLGATACTPAEPCCGECPLRSCCRALRDGLTDRSAAQG